MYRIEVYGHAEQEICEGCDGDCGSVDCAPGGKRPTSELVADFAALAEREGFPIELEFYEATEENIARHPDVQRLLSMADLAPIIVFEGKVRFMGGFSAQGLLDELKKGI